MKKLIVIVAIVLLLSGCATQKSWHIKCLEKDIEQYKKGNLELNNTLQAVRQTAIQRISIYELLIQDFILITDPEIADSLLKKRNLSYTLEDGTVIGE